MLRSLLFMQWKTARWTLLILLPLCVGLPILATRLAAQVTADGLGDSALEFIRLVQVWAPMFPLLAGVTGATLALAAWSWDHRSNHVYALSMPLPRWEYVLLKMAAGAILLAIPITGVLVGALVATQSISLPEGLVAYPFAFAGRFMLGALLCYALVFALGAGTMQTTVRIVGTFLVVLVFGSILVEFLRGAFDASWLRSPIELLASALLEWPGPFSVFGGSWTLIDV